MLGLSTDGSDCYLWVVLSFQGEFQSFSQEAPAGVPRGVCAEVPGILGHTRQADEVTVVPYGPQRLA
jgi:hypothetical protein